MTPAGITAAVEATLPEMLANTAATPPNDSDAVPGAPAGTSAGAPRGMTFAAAGAPISNTAVPALANPPTASAVPADVRVDALVRIAGAGTTDVYHGSTDPHSPTLLTQKGVGAYVQLLNVLAGNESHEKSVNSLTVRLQNASSALKMAYSEAVSGMPPRLAAKDWSFSVADGKLVFTAGRDVLSEQDVIDLHNAFVRPNVESPAKQLAAVIANIVEMRKAGADSGSLAWARFDVSEDNFADAVDLRNYVTASAPGSHYHPGTANSVNHPQVPPTLGGMDLRELVTARPRFLRSDGSVSPEAVDELQAPPVAPQTGMLQGQCSCGQVRFIVQDEFEYAFYCHCSRCRARTGSVFAAIAGITIEKMEVIAGHEHLLLEGECSDGYGARCGGCHSFLFSAVRGRQYLHVSLGVVAGSPRRLPDHHIYVGSKAPWYQITDALPRYDEAP